MLINTIPTLLRVSGETLGYIRRTEARFLAPSVVADAATVARIVDVIEARQVLKAGLIAP